IAEVAVIADSPDPVSPCGGCRQKLAEFAGPEVLVTMATLAGTQATATIAALLPGAFKKSHMDAG
nr:cytidine deaminase [Rhodobacter sp.]